MAKLNLKVDESFFENQIPEFSIQLKEEDISKPEVEEKVIPQKRSFMEMHFSMVDDIIKPV